jgi:3'-phosphoadenosine 5'-phosphosulfate sulfotransferase (PAPS reductase)/FAD synthetase
MSQFNMWPKESIASLITRGATFFCNHSGGKDSQAMFIKLRELVPKDQLIIIHAHLPEVEWEGTVSHIEKYADGYWMTVCQAKKTFFEMVEHRQMFPSASTRQCTSDLKRGPIEKRIREISKNHNRKLIVNCMGMRAEESPNRAKKAEFQKSERNSKSGREWYDWLPVHDMSEKQVFKSIKDAGEKPFWTYAEGMKRKSCSFCIMACKSDLTIAARLRPELFQKYVETEKRIGHTLMMPTKKHGVRTLDEIIK